MREIPLSRGLVAVVDEADYDLVCSVGPWWADDCDGIHYAGHWLRGPRRNERLHTFLTGWPYVDHRNGNGLDNRRANLRPATISQNNANRRRGGNNTSGYKGVSLYRRTGRWRAYVGIDSHQHHVGYFDSPEEAARAYDTAAAALFGEFARPNFPEGIPA